MTLPEPRGDITQLLRDHLRQRPHTLPRVTVGDGDPLHDEDLQVALYVCYELHYMGFADVDDDWEWQPSLLALRAVLEEPFLARLRDLTRSVPDRPDQSVPDALRELVAADDGPPLSKFLAGRADLDQFREFVMHRSIYHLREADAHTWGIPRLQGPAKAALVEVQVDEYGNGQLARVHAELFRTTMRELDLDGRYRAYLDQVPAITLAVNNTMSFFGLHRRWLPALLGHLAAFEMTSSLPNRRYGNGLRRLGGSPTATRFYDEHVEADAVHEQIAAHDLCGQYAREHPDRRADILFGAACALAVDGLHARHLLSAWARGESSLRPVLALTSAGPA